MTKADDVKKRALACVLAAAAVARTPTGEDDVNAIIQQMWPEMIDFAAFEIAIETALALMGACDINEELVAEMATQAINEATE